MILKNEHGSAMLMALLVTVVLALLAFAIITLSMGNLNVNQADALNNDSYYAATAGVDSAIEQLKFETTRYYNQMMSYADSGTYPTLFDNFFSAIKNNAQVNFSEPPIPGVTTSTTFSSGTYDAGQDATEYLVSCTSTAPDGAQYVVNGKLTVKRVDVRVIEPYNWISDGAAVKAGLTLDLGSKNSVTVNEGDILVGNLQYTGNNPPYIVDGSLTIDPSVRDTIQDKLEYPSFKTPVLTSWDYYYGTDTTISNSIPLPSGKTSMVLTTADNVIVKFIGTTTNHVKIPKGTVYVKGDVTLTFVDLEGDLYCDGNISISKNCNITGKIFVRGNLDSTNAVCNGDLYVDGHANYVNGDIYSTLYSGNGIYLTNVRCYGNLFSFGLIEIHNSEVVNGIVYSKSKLKFGSANNKLMQAIFFSGNDIEFTADVDVQGMVIAKDNIYFTVDANQDLFVNYYYTYSEGAIENIINSNPFFFTSKGASTVNTDIFLNKSVSPEGRAS